jgi:uncharacterized tellurite resistance protein B-like protein
MNTRKNQKIQIEHLRSLIAIAMADGFLHENEIAFFKEKAEELGYSEEITEETFKHAENIHVDFSIENLDQEEFMLDLIAMSMIDGELHEREYNLCLKLAKKFGWSKEEVDGSIKLIKGLLEGSSN